MTEVVYFLNLNQPHGLLFLLMTRIRMMRYLREKAGIKRLAVSMMMMMVIWKISEQDDDDDDDDDLELSEQEDVRYQGDGGQ